MSSSAANAPGRLKAIETPIGNGQQDFTDSANAPGRLKAIETEAVLEPLKNGFRSQRPRPPEGH